MAHEHVFGFWNDRTKAEVYTKSQADYLFATYSTVGASYTPLYSHNSSSWDTTPTSDSTKPVTSGGIKNAVDALDAAISALDTSTDGRLDDIENWIGDAILTPQADFVIDEGTCTTNHGDYVDVSGGLNSLCTYYNIEDVTWHWQKWYSGKFTASAMQETTWQCDISWGSLHRGYTLARQEMPFYTENSVKKYFLIGAPSTCIVNIVGLENSCVELRSHYNWLTDDLSSHDSSPWPTPSDAPSAPRYPKPGESTFKFMPVIEPSVSSSSEFLVTYYIEGRWKN